MNKAKTENVRTKKTYILKTKMDKTDREIDLIVYSDGAVHFSTDFAEHQIYLYPDVARKVAKILKWVPEAEYQTLLEIAMFLQDQNQEMLTKCAVCLIEKQQVIKDALETLNQFPASLYVTMGNSNTPISSTYPHDEIQKGIERLRGILKGDPEGKQE